jgi:hypothetical protein
VLAHQGIVRADDTTPEGLGKFIDSEVDKWATVIKNANISVN